MLAALSTVAAAPVQAADPNIIVNGGFEDGLTGWFVEQRERDRQRHAVPHDGRLLRIGRRARHPAGRRPGPARCRTSPARCRPDKTYALTARVKYENPSSPATKQFFATMHYGGATYTNLGQRDGTAGTVGAVEGTFTDPRRPERVDRAAVLRDPVDETPRPRDPTLHLMDFKLDDVS